MFKTANEKNKWESLQDKGSVTIDKMLSGTATPSDIESLTKLVESQHELAGEAFKEGIHSAEATADAIIDKMNADRIAIGKRPLTPKAQDRLFKQTFQKVLQAASEDILGAVQDRFDEESVKSDERATAISRVLQKRPPAEPQAAEKVEPATPDDAETQRKLDDLKHELAAIPEKTNRSLSERFRDLKHVAMQKAKDAPNTLRGLSRNALAAIKKTPHAATITAAYVKTTLGQMRDAVVDGWAKITKKEDPEDEDKKSETWLRKLRNFFGDKFDKAKSKASKVSSLLGKIFGPIGKILLLALTNPQLIATVTAAVSKYLNFDTIETFMANTWKEIKDGGSQVLDWVVKKIKDAFSMNNEDVKKTAAKTATKEGQATIAASVAKESAIPTNTTVADAKKAIPDIQDKIKGTKNLILEAQKDLQKDPSDRNKIRVSHLNQRLQILQGQLANYQTVISSNGKSTGASAPPPTTIPMAPPIGGDKSVGSNPTDVKKLVTAPGAASAPGGTTATPTAGTTSTTLQGPSPEAVLSSSSAAAPKDTTQIVTDKPLTYKEGVSVAPPAPAQAPGGADKQNGSGTSPGVASLGSFGFQSADDSLNILNMGLIS
jgi:hypothetical protein